MRKLIFTFLIITLFFVSNLQAQIFYTENFETYDSLSLPPGWSKWNQRWYPINEFANWTVRDTGKKVPNIGLTSKAKDGVKSIMVSWGTSLSSAMNHPLDTADLSDAWLVTKQFRNLPSDAFLSFWACGGRAPNYLADSLQIWVSTTDSLPSSFTHYIETEYWISGFVYGEFQNYFIDLTQFAGQNIRIAFRYYMDCAIDGYAVYLDKFEMIGTIGINQIGSNVPKDFGLSQNYPNPFNPTTKIKFEVPKNTNVKIEVFNNLGQVVKVLHDGFTNAGYYETDFNASSLNSGIYYYRMTAGQYIQTKKMVLVK